MIGGASAAFKIVRHLGPARCARTILAYTISRLTDGKVPLAVTIEATAECNLSCSYCGRSRPERELSTSEILTIIDEFYDLGMIRLGFSGGEITTRNDLGRLLDHAVGKGIFTSIFSNGFRTVELIDEISCIQVYNTSLDGRREAHDRVRGAGAWDRAVGALETVLDRGIPAMSYTVVSNESVDEVKHVLDLAHRMGFVSMFAPVFRHARQPESSGDVGASIAEVSRAFGRILEMKRDGAPVGNSEPFLEFMASGLEGEAPGCHAGIYFCGVGPGGEVAPCGPMLGSEAGLDGRKLGYANAFRRLPRGQCMGGFCFVGQEMSYLIDLNPRALVSLFK